MTKCLLRWLKINPAEALSAAERGAVGKLSGGVGIVCNVLLFGLKLAAGILSGSVSVTADAMNNLTDASSSVVTLLGFRLAEKPADKDHPYGHARFEYLSGLAVAAIIVVIGFELAKTSVEKVFAPAAVSFSPATAAVLIGAILIKLWLAGFNGKLARYIDSQALAATAADSRNDCIATGAVLLAAAVSAVKNREEVSVSGAVLLSSIISAATGADLDGWMGLAVALFILYSGAMLAKETVSPLLGEAASPELRRLIVDYVSSQPKVLGYHDLMVHDYGPGRCMASVHAEVPVNADIVKIHEIIDNTEKKIQEDLGIHIVIHMDPITVADSRIEEVRQSVLACVHEVNPVLGIHDFRMTDGEQNINLIFDLEVPYSMKPAERDSIVAAIKTKLKEKDVRFNAVIQIDNKF